MTGDQESKSLKDTEIQQTQSQDINAQIHSDDSSLNIHLDSLDGEQSNLDMSTIDNLNETANQDGTSLTSFQNQSVKDSTVQDSSVQDQSVADSQLVQWDTQL